MLAVVLGLLLLRRSGGASKHANPDEQLVAAQGARVRKEADAKAKPLNPGTLGEGLKFDPQGNLIGAPATGTTGLENVTVKQITERPHSSRKRASSAADAINEGLLLDAEPSMTTETTDSGGGGMRLLAKDPAMAEVNRAERRENRELFTKSLLAYSRRVPPQSSQAAISAGRGEEMGTHAGAPPALHQSVTSQSLPGSPAQGGLAPMAPRPNMSEQLMEMLKGGGSHQGRGASDRPMKSALGDLADMRIGGGPEFTIHEGQFLDLVVHNRIEASFAGSPVVATVNRDFLSPDGKYVLFPHGTQLLGEAGKVESNQQARVYIAFHRAIFHDGRSAYFPQHLLPPAMNADGSYGVVGKVNRHFWLQFGSAIALGVIDGLAASAAGPTMVETSGNTSTITTPPGQIVAQRVSNDLSIVVMEMIKKYANVVPTIVLKPGTRMKLYFIEDTRVNAHAPSRRMPEPAGSR